MSTDIETLHRLGGLHDAEVEEVVWRRADRSLRLVIGDMLANFSGLPGYEGPKRGELTFMGLSRATGATAPFVGRVRISGVDVEKAAGGLEIRLGLSEPGSDLTVLCEKVLVTIFER